MPRENGKVKQLLKGTAIYAVGSFGTKLLNFLIVPLYTYYISTEDMGVYDLLSSVINLLAPIVTLQMSDAAFRWLIREAEDQEQYVRATIQIMLTNFLVVAIVSYTVNLVWPIPYFSEFILLLITTHTLSSVQKLLRGLKNQKLFVVSGIVYTVVFLALNVIQICIYKKGVSSLFTSAIVANLAAIAFAYIRERRLRISIWKIAERSVVKKMLRYSVPLVPNQLNWWVISSSNRLVITYFLGMSANGVFAVANKFPTMLQLAFGFFTTAWQDVAVAEKEGQNTSNSDIFEQLYTLALSMLWVLVPATKLFISFAMADAYKEAANYISLLYLGAVFQAFASFYGVGYLRDKNTKQVSLTSIYGAAINVVLNLLLMQYLGLHTAAISTLVGFAVMWIIRERQNGKTLNIQLDKKKFALYLTAALAVCLVGCFSSVPMDCMAFVAGTIGFVYVNRGIIMQVGKHIVQFRASAQKVSVDEIE